MSTKAKLDEVLGWAENDDIRWLLERFDKAKAKPGFCYDSESFRQGMLFAAFYFGELRPQPAKLLGYNEQVLEE